MTRAWMIRWDFHFRRLTVCGLARKYGMTIPQIEWFIRDTEKEWKRLRARA